MSASRAAVAIQGGAGVDPGHDYALPAAFMEEALQRAGEALAAGRAALDLAVDLVSQMEDSGLFIAGRGSSPNDAGGVELDAAVMHGPDARAGSVAAVRNVMSPVRLARAVMERTPHVMLAGEGAEAFADREGLPRVTEPGDYYRPAVDITGGAGTAGPRGPLTHGTVGAVALDTHGRLAAATSTGGTLNKMHGRVGGVPLHGAGNWADSRVAVSCTGTGEHFVRAAAAHDVAARVRYAGESLESACRNALDTVASLGGDGGLVAVDRDGNVVMRFNTAGMKRGLVRIGEPPQVAVR